MQKYDRCPPMDINWRDEGAEREYVDLCPTPSKHLSRIMLIPLWFVRCDLSGTFTFPSVAQWFRMQKLKTVNVIQKARRAACLL